MGDAKDMSDLIVQIYEAVCILREDSSEAAQRKKAAVNAMAAKKNTIEEFLGKDYWLSSRKDAQRRLTGVWSSYQKELKKYEESSQE